MVLTWNKGEGLKVINRYWTVKLHNVPSSPLPYFSPTSLLYSKDSIIKRSNILLNRSVYLINDFVKDKNNNIIYIRINVKLMYCTSDILSVLRYLRGGRVKVRLGRVSIGDKCQTRHKGRKVYRIISGTKVLTNFIHIRISNYPWF